MPLKSPRRGRRRRGYRGWVFCLVVGVASGREIPGLKPVFMGSAFSLGLKPAYSRQVQLPP